MNRVPLVVTVTGLGLFVLYIAVVGMDYLMEPPQRHDRPLKAQTLENPAQHTGTIEVWSWDIAAKSLGALVPAFNTNYPNISVNVNMTGANMPARFFLSLSAGVGAPDISQIEIREAPRYAATGQLADLTEVAAKYRHAFPESFWANCEYDGRIYAIPWDMGPCAVFYKRDIFNLYGIDPNQIETWDDFIEAGQHILEQSGGHTRMLALSTGRMQGMFEILMQQNGAQIFDDAGRIVINSPEAREVLSLIKRLLDSGICYGARPWTLEYMAGLKNDTIATYPTAVWFGGTIKDTVQDFAGQASNWGVFRLPAITSGGLRNSNLGGSVLIIPKQSTQKEAAWVFLEYALCTIEGQIAQYRNYDLYPAYLPAQTDPFFNEPDPFYGNQIVRRLFSTDLTRIPILNRTRDWMPAERYLGQALSQWATTGMDIDTFLENFERKLASRTGRAISGFTIEESPSRIR